MTTGRINQVAAETTGSAFGRARRRREGSRRAEHAEPPCVTIEDRSNRSPGSTSVQPSGTSSTIVRSFGQTTDLSPSVAAKHAYCGDSRRLLRRVPSRVQSSPSEVPFSRVRNIQDNRGQRNNAFVARAIRVNPVLHQRIRTVLFEAPARTRLLASSGRAPAKKPPCFLGSCFLGLCLRYRFVSTSTRSRHIHTPGSKTVVHEGQRPRRETDTKLPITKAGCRFCGHTNAIRPVHALPRRQCYSTVLASAH